MKRAVIVHKLLLWNNVIRKDIQQYHQIRAVIRVEKDVVKQSNGDDI